MVNDPFQLYRQTAVDAVTKVLSDMGISTVPGLEVPPEGMGDFGFPFFALAKEARKAPAQIAAEVAEKLKIPPELGMTFETAGPYVNFQITEAAMSKTTVDALVAGGLDFGKGEPGGEKLAVEHTSANPNGPLHVGRARNPIVGDTISRLLRFSGRDVDVLYWVNDMGKQAAFLTWGLFSIKGSALEAAEREKVDTEFVRYYQKAVAMNKEDPRVEEEVNLLLRNYETAVSQGKLADVIFAGGSIQHDDVEYKPIKASDIMETCMKVLDGMKASLGRMHVSYDEFILESRSIQDNTVEQVISKLNGSEVSDTSEDGARFLELESFGIQGRNTKFTYTRSDGTSLYTTRDLAFHKWKLSTYPDTINVLGEDHKLQAKQLAIALGIMGFEKPPVSVFHSFVSLPEGKMSTRKGRVVYLDDLLDEATGLALEIVKKNRPEVSEEEGQRIAELVGMGAVRYNIVKVQTDKKITFKWEDALNFDGASAPFVQYSHARICGILRKAEEQGLDITRQRLVEAAGNYDTFSLTTHDHKLLKTLAQFPSLVQDLAADLRIHLLPEYAQTLASTFHSFYTQCPVAVEKDEGLRDVRLFMVMATKDVLANLLGILGIEAPESM